MRPELYESSAESRAYRDGYYDGLRRKYANPWTDLSPLWVNYDAGYDHGVYDYEMDLREELTNTSNR